MMTIENKDTTIELIRAVDAEIIELGWLSLPGKRMGQAEERREALHKLTLLWFELKRRLLDELAHK